MRCPQCDHNQRRRDGTTCARCGRRFFFDPKARPSLRDRRVEMAYRHVTTNGERWCTPNQVMADLVRRRKLRLGITRAKRERTAQAASGLIQQYARTTPGHPKLITDPGLERATLQPWSEPDLFDYGAERILVVDDRLVVDLLVRNDVHAEARAIIVSLDGYPASVVPRARATVADRPDIPVAVLHNRALPVAVAAPQARQLLGATDQTFVYDLGLSPNADRGSLKVLRWARRLRDVPVDYLPLRYLVAGLIQALTTGTTVAAAAATDDGNDGIRLAWLALADDYG